MGSVHSERTKYHSDTERCRECSTIVEEDDYVGRCFGLPSLASWLGQGQKWKEKRLLPSVLGGECGHLR